MAPPAWTGDEEEALASEFAAEVRAVGAMGAVGAVGAVGAAEAGETAAGGAGADTVVPGAGGAAAAKGEGANDTPSLHSHTVSDGAGCTPEVNPHAVYLAGVPATRDLAGLQAHGCTHVLSLLMPDEYPMVSVEELELCENKLQKMPRWPGIEYKRIHVNDVLTEDLSSHFAEAHAFIDAALASGGSVLVHCRQGVSRSVSVVASYLMAKRKWTSEQALAHIKEARSAASPNPSFLEQLRRYEDSIL